MATDLDNTLKTIATQIADYVKDAATLTVETQYVQIGAETATFEKALPAARTTVRLDGDSQTIVPMRAAQIGLEVDTTLFDLHMRNVAAAVEYRTKVLAALLTVLPTTRRA